MGTQQPIRKTVTPEIPDKLYFRIGDVARLCEVPTYVLRFWETEFPQLKPNKGGTGQRLYRRRDVELALRIKSLLYDQGYTIPGARQVFKNESAARSAEASAVTIAAEPVSGAGAAVAGSAAGFAAPAAQPDDGGEGRRRTARLRHLREEMAALLASLSAAPASAAERGNAAIRNKPEPKVQAMRPRLVVEPRAGASLGAGTAAPNGYRLQLAQRDLFAGGRDDGGTADEWPEPPAAS